MSARQFVVHAAGLIYGPFENASDAAEWFMRTRPHYVAPWTIGPLTVPDGDAVNKSAALDVNVTRVDEHGVAYNAAGESIGITGELGPS